MKYYIFFTFKFLRKNLYPKTIKNCHKKKPIFETTNPYIFFFKFLKNFNHLKNSVIP